MCLHILKVFEEEQELKYTVSCLNVLSRSKLIYIYNHFKKCVPSMLLLSLKGSFLHNGNRDTVNFPSCKVKWDSSLFIYTAKSVYYPSQVPK